MTIETLKEIIKPALDAIELELWGIELIGQGGGAILRVYIEGPNGASIDDCAKATRQLSTILDVEDVMSARYTLEVSTPGMERILFEKSQYAMYVGKSIKVKLSQPLDGRRKYIGVLTQLDDDQVTLKLEEDSVLIPFQIIKKANLIC